jgi:hypothetical protein
VSELRQGRKYILPQISLDYITRLHVSTHYPGHYQFAADLEVETFTTAEGRIILIYNRDDIHILLYVCVCVYG